MTTQNGIDPEMAKFAAVIAAKREGLPQRKPADLASVLNSTPAAAVSGNSISAEEAAAEADRLRRVAAAKAEEKLQGLLRAAAMPLRHASRKCELTPAQARFREAVNGNAGKGFLYVLAGERGTGKTQVSVAIGLDYCAAGRSVRYALAMDVFARLRECYRVEGLTETGVMAEFVQPRLLIVDEAHVRGETAFEDRTLTTIIDKRYAAMVDTILITNQTGEAFAETVGDSAVSRMNECGGVVVCIAAKGWKNHRAGGEA